MTLFLADPIFWAYFIIVLIVYIGGNIVGDYSKYRKSGSSSSSDPFLGSGKIVKIPSYVFVLVWTALFILMLAAAYIADINANTQQDKDIIRSIFFIQIFFNLLWSYVAFGLGNIELALIIHIILITLVAYLTYFFFTVDALAGWLFVPYLIWIVFALYLLLKIMNQRNKNKTYIR